VTELSESTPSVQAYAKQLSVRLSWIYALRGLCLAGAAATMAVLLASWIAEPVLTRSSALAVWAAVVLAAGAALGFALWPLWQLRGARVAQVIARTDEKLSHRMRSALELSSAAAPEGSSRELLSAHLADVQRALHGLPATRVLPWSQLWHVSVLGGLLSLLAFAWLSLNQDTLHAFVQALIAPAHERSDGTRVAPVVAELRVRLAYPSYLGRDPSWVEKPAQLTVPAGTTLEVHVKPRFPAERGRVLLGAASAAMQKGREGELSAQLTVQTEASMRLEISKNGVRYEDPRAIPVHVTPDATPVIHIDEPQSGTLAPPGEVIALRYTANDDVGIANVQLHARLEAGADKQRVIFSALDDGGPARELRSSATITPEELGAREGDSLVIWLEARDTDLVSGPHVGRSQEITLEVAQPGQGLSEFIPSLQHIADSAVDVLAQRLELQPARESSGARGRFEVVNRAARGWLSQIDALLRRAEQSNAAGLEVDQLRGLRKRNDHLLTMEAGLHAPAVRSYAERSDADHRQIDELERDVILLADMLARAHVDEAKAIADELRGLKRHIEELLSELGKSHSPEAERELMREIAKAQRRLAELSQSLSRMATRVPSEFVNRDALHKEAAESELASLERAVQERDLRSAAEHLDALAKQIDELASQIGQGGLRLQEQRFGPRDQALAEARQKLGMLGSEQNRLTERSGEITKNALERGQRGMSEARAQSLAPRADALGREAEQLAQGQASGFGSAAASRAAERLRDARDALKAGDLAQARGMAQSAERGLRETASELENESRMFPGQRADSAQRASRARQAAADAERLSDEIDRAIPELPAHMNEGERQRVRADADAQRRTADAADQLKQQFDKGPDGLPLSPEASESLDAVRKNMQQAQRSLERGRPDEANRQQQEASERLQKLSESLAEQQRGGGRAGRGNKEGMNGDAERDARVHIPGAEEWKGPTELRRKLLDAMQEAAPSGYEAAIKRYYQELMR